MAYQQGQQQQAGYYTGIFLNEVNRIMALYAKSGKSDEFNEAVKQLPPAEAKHIDSLISKKAAQLQQENQQLQM